jgi:Tfp pilus assembly protein PilF
MNMKSRRFLLRYASTVALAVSAQLGAVAAQEVERPLELIEAERLATAGDWDQIIVSLTQLIQRLDTTPRDARSGRLLIEAYERRALARLQTGDRSNATIDLAALLQIDPNYAFAAPSPGIMGFYEETRKSTLASLDLVVSPDDAIVVLEKSGVPSPETSPTVRLGPQWLTAGSYRITARKIGYETRTEEFELGPGKSLRLPVELRRTSAVLFIRTIPAGVSVRVDGELRGTTEADPNGGGRSKTLMIEGLVPRPNPYRFQMEKDCFVPSAGEVLVPPLEIWKGVAAPDPLVWDPDLHYEQVSLRPAFGTIEVTADQPGAVVLIDGERRGTAGKPITDVCHGDHSVDVRSPTGRSSERVKIEFDNNVRLQAKLIPTYGVVSAVGRNGSAGVQGVLNAVTQALRTENFNLVPVELTEADVAALSTAKTDGLRSVTDRLIQRLDTQGVATLARVAPDAEGQDLELALFAAGSSRPDIVRFSLQTESSVRRAVARLAHQVPIVRQGIGIEAVDVMRVDGVVVTRVDPNGPSARAIAPGDVIVSIGSTSIADVRGLVAALEKTTDATVSVRLRDKPAPVTVVVERRPNVVSVYDSRPFNVVISELNARLARQQLRSGAPSAEEQRLTEGMRLNLAAALMAVGNYSAAQQTLTQVRLESRPGISKGTVDYLRAVCYKQLGQLAEARALFEAASQEPDALLTERGPAVSYLAREELLALGAASRE